ncbi:MAG: iron transporter [Propionibacteriaceae bacterium]|jgi:uncharacterized protein involved in high-affinity Fe2+ transport|nr:iron transporter [Propionibacteriaceae bacterium]
MKTIIRALGLSVVVIMTLAGCSGTPATTDQPSAQPQQSDPAAAPAPGDAGGFEEFEIGDDIEVGPLNVAGVYFQPVDMDPAMGLTSAEADIHIEADISALPNNLGFGTGDWVPNLTVDYEITDPAGKVNSGTFMPMNASDGPHYGANIKMGDAGTYKVKFIIKSPAENGHLIHTDAVTGVEGRFWTEPLVAEWDDFQYSPREW